MTKKTGEQAEINIGMIGHVDHGKCIAEDEFILLNNELTTGSALADTAQKNFEPEKISASEKLYKTPGLRAFSLSPDFSPVSAGTNVFVQQYSGKMFEVLTRKGKKLTASPMHPLLVNDGNEIAWKKISELKKGDYIASLKTIPNQEYVKDYSGNWKEKMAEEFWVVEKNDFSVLREKSADFTDFTGFSADEFNTLRILTKNSALQLGKKIYCTGMAEAFKKNRATKKQGAKLAEFFSLQKPEEPRGTIINYKKNTKSFCEINTTNFWNSGILRLIAFITAEGHIAENKVMFAQKKNELLKEVLGTLRKEFNVEPAQTSAIDFQIYNKALVRYFTEKYGMKKGASRQAGIPEWVFSLPKKETADFLNMFYSAEANFNPKSGQIELSQANEKSILLLSYCLKKFGITHSIHPVKKYASNTIAKTKRTYFQLTISGIENIKKFEIAIGVTQAEKAKNLKNMAAKKMHGKKTNEMIPLRFETMSKIVSLLGWKKKNYSKKTGTLRKHEWFYAYNDCLHKNSISTENLRIFLKAGYERINSLKKIAGQKNYEIKKAIGETAISQRELAEKLGISQKMMHKALLRTDSKTQKTIRDAVSQTIMERIAMAETSLAKIEANSPEIIEWDKVYSIKGQYYEGRIVDLQIPGYHNFAAGTGAIISHNTSLVQALTGKWADTHSEELKQGISIRLGYADAVFYKCDKVKGAEAYNSTGKCAEGMGKAVKTRRVSFVDAPGHETLMATMLSGAALMNGAVLVIASNEKCPQPRTAEHLMALSISGVKNVVVAQNKIDLVDAKRAKESLVEIQGFLKNYGYENSPVIPISANLGVNIDLLIEAIESHIPTPKKEKKKDLKMFVVRSFDINKPGTKIKEIKGGVLGGSIISGKIKIGDKILISPGIEGKPMVTEVVSLGAESGMLEEAHAGGLIAVGTKLDPYFTKNDEMRGQIVAKPGSLPEPVRMVTVEMNYIERLLDGVKANEIKANDYLVLAIGTNTAVGQVAKLVGKNTFDVALKVPVVVEKGQKISVSKKEQSGWRLRALGTVK